MELFHQQGLTQRVSWVGEVLATAGDDHRLAG